MSVDAPSEVDVRSFLELMSQIKLSRYCNGIALTLCVYDWLMLVQRESQTVWKARWTRMKVMYYINRVVTVVGLIITVIQSSDLWTIPLPQRFCHFYIWFASMLQMVSFFISTIILTLRIVALYNRHMFVVRLVYCLLLLNWLVTFVAATHTLYFLGTDLDYMFSARLCISRAHTPAASIIFISPAVYECILLLLTAYRAIQDVRNRVLGTNQSTPFLAILYRDGFYYFAAVFAVHSWNSLAYLTLPMTGIFMGVYVAWSVMTVMSGRVYLNLVLAAQGWDGNGETTAGLPTLPTLRKSKRIITFGAINARNTFPLTTLSSRDFENEA